MLFLSCMQVHFIPEILFVFFKFLHSKEPAFFSRHSKRTEKNKMLTIGDPSKQHQSLLIGINLYSIITQIIFINRVSYIETQFQFILFIYALEVQNFIQFRDITGEAEIMRHFCLSYYQLVQHVYFLSKS